MFQDRQMERLEDRHKEIGRTESDYHNNNSNELYTHMSYNSYIILQLFKEYRNLHLIFWGDLIRVIMGNQI